MIKYSVQSNQSIGRWRPTRERARSASNIAKREVQLNLQRRDHVAKPTTLREVSFLSLAEIQQVSQVTKTALRKRFAHDELWQRHQRPEPNYGCTGTKRAKADQTWSDLFIRLRVWLEKEISKKHTPSDRRTVALYCTTICICWKKKESFIVVSVDVVVWLKTPPPKTTFPRCRLVICNWIKSRRRRQRY